MIFPQTCEHCHRFIGVGESWVPVQLPHGERYVHESCAMPVVYDAVTIIGPYDVPDLERPEQVLPNGKVVPARTLDMSDRFELRAEYRHEACGNVHGVTTQGSKSTIAGWPEMLDAYIRALRGEVVNRVEDCDLRKGARP